LVDSAGQPITTPEQWQRRRAEIRAEWLAFLRPFSQSRPTPPALETLSNEPVGDVLRQRVRYEVEPGCFTEAYVLKPAHTGPKRPAVAVFHSTVAYSIHQPGGVEGPPETAFGLKLARQGYVTLCPRNFLWPDNEHIDAESETRRFQERHPGSRGMAKMLWDAQVAMDILAGLPEVDPQRLGAVGHSLGAKEVLYLAAFDERIRATVSSEGGIGTGFSNWDAPWYLGPEVKQPAFTHEHHELLGLIAPRAFLLIGGDSADGDQSWPFIEAALPVYHLAGGPSRIGLYNHKQGHSVPVDAERRIDEWFQTDLPG